MTNHNRHHLIKFIGITLLVSIICSGCAGMQGTNLEKQRYLLNVHRQTGQSETAGELVVKVRGFHISSRFSGKPLTYRTGEVSYETDFYNEFLTSPASNITEEATKWLAQSGVFADVTGATSAAESDLLMDFTDDLKGTWAEAVFTETTASKPGRRRLWISGLLCSITTGIYNFAKTTRQP